MSNHSAKKSHVFAIFRSLFRLYVGTLCNAYQHSTLNCDSATITALVDCKNNRENSRFVSNAHRFAILIVYSSFTR